MSTSVQSTINDLEFTVQDAQNTIKDEIKIVRENIDEYVAITNKQFAAEKDKETDEIIPGYTRKTETNTHWYDIHFVGKAYNLLNIGGVLCMIMSNRFLKDKIEAFQVFLDQVEKLNESYPQYIDILKNLEEEYKINRKPSLLNQINEYKFILSKAENNKFYSFKTVSNFVQEREDEGFITKGQEVNFDMVLIRLVKIKDFSIDFTKSRISNVKSANENIIYGVDKENPKQKIKNIGYTIDENGIAKAKVEEKKKIKDIEFAMGEIKSLTRQLDKETDEGKKNYIIKQIDNFKKMYLRKEKSKNNI
jgi:hypothetical protein